VCVVLCVYVYMCGGGVEGGRDCVELYIGDLGMGPGENWGAQLGSTEGAE